MALSPMLQAIDKQPGNASYQYHLGVAYKSLGQNAKARTALNKALTLDPKFRDSEAARQALAEIKGS